MLRVAASLFVSSSKKRPSSHSQEIHSPRQSCDANGEFMPFPGPTAARGMPHVSRVRPHRTQHGSQGGQIKERNKGRAGRRKGDRLGGQQTESETLNSSGGLIREHILADQKQKTKKLPFCVCSTLILVKDNKGRASLKGSILLPIMMYRFAGLPLEGEMLSHRSDHSRLQSCPLRPGIQHQGMTHA